MDLRYRLTEADDIEQCLNLLSPQSAYPPDRYAQAAQTFRRLITARLLHSVVMEDYERPPDARIVAFGASVFVTPEYMAQARRGETPGLSAQTLAAIAEGPTPLLDENAIRDANSDTGLHVVVLHSRETVSRLSAEEQRRIQEKWIETFLYAHGGYRLCEMLMEAPNEAAARYVLQTGLRLRSDYAAYYEAHPALPGQRRCLVGVTRAENNASAGQYATVIFQHTPPRCFFNAREQELLRCALTGDTDEELALALGLSLSAVKKRWNAVYARVATLTPPLLPPLPAPTDTEPKRGQEKRRHLLHYLRQHLEELRPVKPPEQ